jgi:hypothetical protein
VSLSSAPSALVSGALAVLARKGAWANLQDLRLRACGLTDAAVHAFAGVALQLRVIDIADNPALTDAGMASISACCATATSIDISGNSLVSDKGAHALLSAAVVVDEWWADASASSLDVAGNRAPWCGLTVSQSSTRGAARAEMALNPMARRHLAAQPRASVSRRDRDRSLRVLDEVDADGDGDDDDEAGSTTLMELHPWWQLDLGAVIDVDAITIRHGLTSAAALRECSPRRLQLHVIVSVQPIYGRDPQAAAKIARAWGGDVLHVATGASLATSDTVSIVLPHARRMRYIRVQLSRDLQLPWSRPHHPDLHDLRRCTLRLQFVEPHRQGGVRGRVCCALLCDVAFELCCGGLSCAGLAFLGLRDTGITDVMMRFIAKKLQNLRALSLAGVASVTAAALQLIAQRCTSLTSLDVGGCSALTPSSVRAVGHHCHMLKQLRLSRWRTVHDRSSSHLASMDERSSVFAHGSSMNSSGDGVWRRGPAAWSDDGLLRGDGDSAVQPSQDVSAMDQSVTAWGLTDAALAAVVQGCPALTSLDISGMTRVSDSAVMRLRSLPALQRVSACTAV